MRTRRFLSTVLLAGLGGAAPRAAADECVEVLAPVAGFSGVVRALATFDDGSGSKLWVGGYSLGWPGSGVSTHLARFDGQGWQKVPIVASGSASVTALAVLDLGSGPELYASEFNSGLYRWSGSSWVAVLTGSAALRHSALAAFDYGSGPRLFGSNESRVNRVSQGSAIAVGTYSPGNMSPTALAVFDDGGGPRLYFGGRMTRVSGVNCAAVARWDSAAAWSRVGVGFTGAVALGTTPAVFALLPFDDGTGTHLYAGGTFANSDGAAGGPVARWNGAAWTPVGSPDPNFWYAQALHVFDAGDGPRLYAGGTARSGATAPWPNILRWDGLSWQVVGNGLPPQGGSSGDVVALATFDGGRGPQLFAGGAFRKPGTSITQGLARRQCACGDADGDGQSDAADWAILAANFGLAVEPGTLGDFTFDGVVDQNDMDVLLFGFGRPCP